MVQSRYFLVGENLLNALSTLHLQRTLTESWQNGNWLRVQWQANLQIQAVCARLEVGRYIEIIDTGMNLQFEAEFMISMVWHMPKVQG